MKAFMRFLKDEKGLTTVEYAIAGGLVGAGAIAAFALVGREVARAVIRRAERRVVEIHPRGASGWHVGEIPSPLPVALPRGGVSAAYGVQGAAPSGSGSSPRIAIQIRSGLSA